MPPANAFCLPGILLLTLCLFPGLLVSQALAAHHIPIERYDGQKTGRYIVTLKSGVLSSAAVRTFRATHRRNSVEAEGLAVPLVTHQWDNVLNGFTVRFPDTKHGQAALAELQASPDVESIAEDGMVWIAQTYVTQRNAPWVLGRLSSVGRVPNLGIGSTRYNYTYDTRAGAGTDIYILDTGVRTTHKEFGGRARWGPIFGGYAQADGHGHGTHIAAIAAGTQYSCAKNASLIALKVLGDDGGGTMSDVISGLEWVLAQYRRTRRPSVVSLSIGGSPSTNVDNAVNSLLNAGIHVVAAAGNSNQDVSSQSPARVPGVITVGAVQETDARASSSNFGPGVDVFAPGVNIVSAWTTGDSDTRVLSGTSIGAPFVAGAIAYFISISGNTSPANMTKRVKDWSLEGILSDIPQGTPNLLLTNSYVCGLEGEVGMQICI